MDAKAILDHFKSREAVMLADLKTLVEHESPSRDKPALDRLAKLLAERLRSAGGSVEILDGPEGDQVLARFVGSVSASASTRPALILAHFDTVWPHGTLAKMPFRVEQRCAYGPGTYDMKSGIVLCLSVLEALQEMNIDLPRALTVLFTSDEEVGSTASRPWIEGLARESAYVLVLEPPMPDGSLKTSRKGVGRFTLEVEGKASHAGVAPEEGASAILELAHQVIGIHALADPAAGTTLNVGVVQGGTTSNVVPAAASASIDARASSSSEAERVTRALSSLTPKVPGTRLRVTGGFTRPPMERTPHVVSLFQQARSIARRMGLELTEGSTGGGSDANFTAALGIPTLDGLGARGKGAHAIDEQILVESLPERAALLMLLLLELEEIKR